MHGKLSLALLSALAVATQALGGYEAPSADRYGPLPVGPSAAPYPVPSGSGIAPIVTGPTGTGDSAAPYPFPSSSGIAPIVTGPTGTGDSGSLGPIQTGVSTYTYTVGTGTMASVITKTISYTSHLTNYETVYATRSTDAAKESAAAEGKTSGADSAAAAAASGTSTIRETSTMTRVIYITATSSSTGTSAAYNQDNSASAAGSVAGAAGSSGVDCAAPVTVTVTGADVTVTVTADKSIAATSSAGNYYGMPNSTNPELGPTSSKYKSTGFITMPSASFNPYPTASGIMPVRRHMHHR